MKNHKYSAFILCLIFIFLMNCTKNPVFEDDKIAARGKFIRGKIQLSDHSSPDGAFVWLEEFDLGTYTNTNGNFVIELPPASSGGTGTGEFYNIYYYIANYRFDSSTVFIRNNELEYSKGDINDKGELKSVKTLGKLLDIKTTINPGEVPQDYGGELGIRVTLQGVGQPVSVSMLGKYGAETDVIAGGFIRMVDTPTQFVSILDITSIKQITETVGNSPRTWNMIFGRNISDLALERYEIIPYIIVNQKNIPTALIHKIGSNVLQMHPAYLYLPMKRTSGYFKVIAAH